MPYHGSSGSSSLERQEAYSSEPQQPPVTTVSADVSSTGASLLKLGTRKKDPEKCDNPTHPSVAYTAMHTRKHLHTVAVFNAINCLTLKYWRKNPYPFSSMNAFYHDRREQPTIKIIICSESGKLKTTSSQNAEMDHMMFDICLTAAATQHDLVLRHFGQSLKRLPLSRNWKR